MATDSVLHFSPNGLAAFFVLDVVCRAAGSRVSSKTAHDDSQQRMAGHDVVPFD